MGSQANIIVKDKYERTSILLRFGSDGGPELLSDFVWLPFLHAKFLRLYRPLSIEKIQERTMEKELGKPYFIKQALYHFDEYGHLFGCSTEYFSQVMLYAYPFQCFPLSKQKHGWGCDEKPVITVDATKNECILYSFLDISGYDEEAHYLPKVHAEVDAFNNFLAEKLAPEDFESVKLSCEKHGFSASHNALVLHIILNDLDIEFFASMDQ
jgi:hypothetical protein